jgi:hypothetical protein
MATAARGAKNGASAEAPEQLTLSELLDAEPDKLHQVPIDPEGIGGEPSMTGAVRSAPSWV